MGKKTEVLHPLSVHELRNILCEEIQNIRDGKTTPAHVNAITNAAGKVMSSVKLEMEYHKLVGRKPQIPFIGLQEPEPASSDKK